MIPLLIQLGPLPIHSFGLMLMCGILCGWYRLYLSMEKEGLDPQLAERTVFWGALWGIIGARLFYIFSNPGELVRDPLSMIFGQAGFVFYGSLICGAAAVWVVTRRAGVPFLRFADLAAVPLIIGYAVGRIGCHLSGDGDYGIPSDLPWAVSYVLGVVPTPPGVTVHPAPVYETLAAFAIAFILLAAQERRVFSAVGRLFGLYLVLASIERFAVETIRIEPLIALGLTQAQLTSAGLMVIGFWLLVCRRANQGSTVTAIQT